MNEKITPAGDMPEKLELTGSLKEHWEWRQELSKAHQGLAEPVPADGNFPEKTQYIDKDLVWKDYALHMDLYKHYLDLAIKFNALYYAVTGGILSYYLAHANENFTKWALLFPVLMSVFFSLLFLKGAQAVKHLDEELGHISMLFGFSRPDTRILAILLKSSAGLFLIVAGALAALFAFTFS